MKLSKLYSDQPKLFDPILFREGLNVAMAEIRLPENRDKDTHNLGKTTLGRLIDFVLLCKRKPTFFLFKHSNVFDKFTFYLELELENSSFLTISRSVKEPSKINFKRHQDRYQDFSALPLENWDHQKVPFERSINLLDGLIDWRGIKPWNYRKELGYLLRSQDDFQDVFQLRKFIIGAHADWKPFLAHVLGFDAQKIAKHYEKEVEIEEKERDEKIIKSELGFNSNDASKVEGLLLLKKKAVEQKQTLLDNFDFRSQDKEATKQLVDEIDSRIAFLNEQRYSLNTNLKKIIASLKEDKIFFKPDDASRLFEEAGVFFEGQLKKDFQQLIEFNRAITEERRIYLTEERKEIEEEIKAINQELNSLGKKRANTLAFLGDTDIFSKYKKISDEVVNLRADIESLQRQRGFLNRLKDIRADIRKLEDKRNQLQIEIELDKEKQDADQESMFSKIRLFFSEIIEEVLDRKALLSIDINKQGHLEFKTDILDDAGNPTSADDGHSYRKLLCVAFDFAILRAHLDYKYPRFVYHDGVFESLDDRKKENLLSVIRQYTALGIQSIITLIDSDLPVRDNNDAVFTEDEIILLLHDEDSSGRLFKMPRW